MPIYEESCSRCGRVNEYIGAISAETRPCGFCGGKTERLFSVPALAVFDSFETTNLHPDGKKIRIGTKRELTRTCHEFGVIPAGDAGAPPQTKFNRPT